ncbi:PREDICTED: uncharacterized protein LOC104727081 isoform X2 [Camelina sativa]|uniref:Uncharacterized protein LOC104727081 isoform X1 n=1 Tax=Camelina sativa TaxID=90675 RepID=A0ABM0UQ34_CAMSA|nr:PREDICTED: uncharacterized protein LOC104727081 isoform X1 [Camelina sativa]XP_010444388.1 PREDICTED: uncharacterized protein LOC104727081 isoform X1 [Camelina sativa]XP_019087171.1 PREDICTED: uncharacterized protein LOC104727081 isoform X2 [Camelina sativa]
MGTTRDFYRGNTNVFWDVEDVSILSHLDPELVYGNIKSDLEDKGFAIDPYLSSTVAIVDDNVSETLKNSYSRSGIRFIRLPGGTKYERVHNMSVHTLLWALREQNMRANLIILSKNLGKDEQFTSLIEAIKKKSDYNIVFHDPTSILDNSVGTPDAIEQIKDGRYRCSTCKSIIKEGESSSRNQ